MNVTCTASSLTLIEQVTSNKKRLSSLEDTIINYIATIGRKKYNKCVFSESDIYNIIINENKQQNMSFFNTSAFSWIYSYRHTNLETRDVLNR
jgi:hypothetical protein